ncbi:hypothetical protein WS67_05395 [Burkholderia singularis]|uniref:D-3-phosphoglycerate dehydrogenase n=1 Tax=Burkholderia singularis TaxID=1503053 RepID=A0A103E708_9BURK|nr:C-terminal binding protein [Burkholderia singularis]KVE29290.1 hypothetical protein WS67_05395 [Burkholderia singularis]
MGNVLVIDGPQSTYLEGLDIERDVFGSEHTVELCRVRDEAEIDGRLEEADVVISWHPVPLGASSFSRMKRCRGVVRAAVGYDNIDVSFARSVDIPVANVPDYGTEEVADHAMAMLLYIVRNLGTTNATARVAWDWRDIGPVPRLRGLHLGLVGFGRIGTALSMRARAFGMICTFYDPWLTPGVEKSLGVERVDDLDTLFSGSQIISVHTPSSPATRRLIGAKQLSLMPRDGILINTSRGDVIRQEELIEHLQTHAEFRAGLDVLSGEPAVPAAIRDSTQVLLSAHSAFYSDASLMEMRRKSALTAKCFYRGEEVRTVVN